MVVDDDLTTSYFVPNIHVGFPFFFVCVYGMLLNIKEHILKYEPYFWIFCLSGSFKNLFTKIFRTVMKLKKRLTKATFFHKTMVELGPAQIEFKEKV